MRTEIKMESLRTLERILESLEQELIDSSDEEILEAARELKMNPEMKGSALYLGLKYTTPTRLSDVFAVDTPEMGLVGPKDAEGLGTGNRNSEKKLRSEDE